MPQTQEERIKSLLDKYTKFVHQPSEDKVKAVRLCGILAYLEAMRDNDITVSSGISQLEKFLDKLVKDYTGTTEGQV